MITSRIPAQLEEVHNYVYFARSGDNKTIDYIERLASKLRLQYDKTTLISTRQLLSDRDGLCDNMAITGRGDGGQVVKFIAEANRLFRGDR